MPKHPHSGLFGRQRCSKSAGRCRLHIQLIQWSRPTCVTVIFVFISLSCRLKRVEGHASLLLFAKQRQQNSCERSFWWKRRFGQSFAQNAEVYRLLETIYRLKFLLFFPGCVKESEVALKEDLDTHLLIPTEEKPVKRRVYLCFL